LIDGQHGQERTCQRHRDEARPDEDEAVDLYTLFPPMEYWEICCRKWRALIPACRGRLVSDLLHCSRRYSSDELPRKD
jgi:hypothetical protein